MPIPDFNEQGLLPPGIHDCTWKEIDDRLGRFVFVGIKGSDRRMKLCQQLQAYLKELQSTHMAVEIVVNGSFVTTKEEPNDIDLMVVLAPDHDFSKELRPFEYNALSKKRVRDRYEFDLFLVRANSPEYQKWQSFVEQVRN